MPIGKNAIKRISNNGYSNVQTTAPDMENSVVEEKIPVVEEKIPVVEEKKITIKKSAKTKQAPKTGEKNTSAPTQKKSMETEPDLSPVKTAQRVTKKSTKAQKRQGVGYVNLGGELPVHLL
ncbi:MAG: hypothetical protein J6A53_00640 [Clostridia bacterium]|nr:hypothetical protein [Clostridia bacterium]